MSKLDNLKKEVKPTAYLKDVHFDDDFAHVAMTTDAGACSLLNESFVMKSLGDAELSEDQIYILREIGEIEEESLEKATALDTDNIDVINEKTEETMSKELEEKVELLTKKLAVADNEKAIAKYELESDLNKELADALVGVEAVTFLKVMDVLVARVEAEVNKAKEAGEAEVVKAKEVVETPLQKELSEEAGDPKEPEEEVEKTQIEMIKAAQEIALAKAQGK
mgnify:FL=1|tara:strand:- start:3563 stop:4231 length:669 start_codon:yes stop_codon:yes gene_type:complete